MAGRWLELTRRGFVLLCCGVLIVATGLVDRSETGRDTAIAQDDPKPQNKFDYSGHQLCQQCHNEDIEEDSRFDRSFCALNESDIYDQDKHLQAWKLLQGKLGQEMQRVLREARNDPEYLVTEDKLCLACHSNWQWKRGYDKPRVYESGVTCESCHGPASDWMLRHAQESWRKVSPQKKEQDHGYIDVRNPIRRAEQCFSCHIGSTEEGKVVTHEMYAAGHPPLPGVEIESFISEMPAHWRLLREKGEFFHYDEYLKLNFPDLNRDAVNDLQRTKSVLVGGVMAMHEALELFVDQARTPNWPELAVFDCGACHHDLQSSSWRRKRGYGDVIPGRPQPFEWPGALIKVAVRHRAGDDDAAFDKDWAEFGRQRSEMIAVLNKTPFGDREGVEQVAEQMLPWLRTLANDVRRSTVRKADAKRALRSLVQLGPDEYPDFHSARQIAWAVRSIQAEVATDYPTLLPRPEGETLEPAKVRGLANLKTFLAWKDGDFAAGRQRVDSAFSKSKLDSLLHLNLPSGIKSVISDDLSQSLGAINDYNPDRFRRQLEFLARELALERQR